MVSLFSCKFSYYSYTLSCFLYLLFNSVVDNNFFFFDHFTFLHLLTFFSSTKNFYEIKFDDLERKLCVKSLRIRHGFGRCELRTVGKSGYRPIRECHLTGRSRLNYVADARRRASSTTAALSIYELLAASQTRPK